MISLIILEIEHPGNLGAIARVMANFDCKKLVLINPKCDKNDEEARNRAKHAQDILKHAIIADEKILDTFDYLIGTTAKLGSDYNIPRSPITPKVCAKIISKQKANIGILIGREGSGLTNAELKKCDFVATIPASKKYGALNISHALTIFLYELYVLAGTQKNIDHFRPMGKKEKEHLTKKINLLLEKLKLPTTEKKETQQKVWKKILGKSMLTRREAFALFGFFKRIDDKLK